MNCPACGTPAERGQLVCIRCGERLALDYRRPYGWKPAAAIAGAVAVIAAIALVVALGAIGDDAEREVASADAAAAPQRDDPPPPTVTAQGPQTETAAEEPGGLASWPADRSAHTVVLVTSSDEAGARNVAEGAAKGGLEAGIIDSDRFQDLGSDLFIVFAGTYPSREQAARAAVRLGERYPGAYPQLIRPASSG